MAKDILGAGRLLWGTDAPFAATSDTYTHLHDYLPKGDDFTEDELQKVLAFLAGLDMRSIAQSVMEEVFRQLAMRYEFSLDGLLPQG